VKAQNTKHFGIPLFEADMPLLELLPLKNLDEYHYFEYVTLERVGSG
jgi:hypothetical protein